eukprot:ANDGO_03239.mRNA.1 hypothetical protein
MFRDPSFWKTENEHPVIPLIESSFSLSEPENAELTRQIGDRILARVPSVASVMGTVDLPAPSEFERIFEMDAERTFREVGRRNLLAGILSRHKKKHGDYHQGLSYIASSLLLVLDSVDAVVAVLDHLSSDDNLMKDVWCAQALRDATDGYVMFEILKAGDAELYSTLMRFTMVPEVWFQKYGTGLAVHILPLKNCYELFELILEHGRKALIKLVLVLLEEVKDQLMASKDIDKVNAILRLDRVKMGFKENPESLVQFGDKLLDTVRRHYQKENVGAAQALLDAVDKTDLQESRVACYEKFLKARVERAKQILQDEEDEDDMSGDFSDTDEDEDD